MTLHGHQGPAAPLVPAGAAGKIISLGLLLLCWGGCPGESTIPALPDGQTAGACAPQNCSGCCLGETCSPGNSDDACGSGGVACLNCLGAGETCDETAGFCSDDCTPNCTGQCAGASNGCGGVCAVNDCQGCCQGTSCVSGNEIDACGSGGQPCSDCSSVASSVCQAGSCTGCTPSCSDKCAGAADGCGGSCATGGCPGCCEGTSCRIGTDDAECGRGGAPCVNCAAGGGKCSGQSCTGCTPSCSGKCIGASDGCGGACSSNSCPGCCSDSQCLPGTNKTACGKNGEKCWVCPNDYQGYYWICQSQVCVKSTPTGTSCDGQTGGTVSCTVDGKTGKCWVSSCCTGCYDVSGGLCRVTTNTNNATCGTGGVACVNCTTSGKICSSTGVCVIDTTNPCEGKTGGTTSCTKDGKAGKCWASSCCTGCYDVSGGLCRVATNTMNSTCGTGGVACVNCTTSGKICSLSGTCKTVDSTSFKVVLVSGKVSSTGPCDSGVCNPFVKLEVGYTPLTAQSKVKSNTVTPYWNEALLTTLGSSIKYKFEARLMHKSVSSSSEIGVCKKSISDADLIGGSLTLSCYRLLVIKSGELTFSFQKQ